MPFIKVNSDEGDILDQNFKGLDGGENMLSELSDPCRAVGDYHGYEFTITSKEAPPPEIEGLKLSMRESEVLQYLANGLSPDQILKTLGQTYLLPLGEVRPVIAHQILEAGQTLLFSLCQIIEAVQKLIVIVVATIIQGGVLQ